MKTFNERVSSLREAARQKSLDAEKKMIEERERCAELYTIAEKLGNKAACLSGIPLKAPDANMPSGYREGTSVVSWRRILAGDGNNPGGVLTLSFHDDLDTDLSFELLTYRFYRSDGKTVYSVECHGQDDDSVYRVEPAPGDMMTYEERILGEILTVVERSANL